MTRDVVVQLWTGARLAQRLRFTAADVDTMSDVEVAKQLRALGVPLPATVVEQRARLKGWPTQADLDAIATAWLPWNDGVLPVVRVLEAAPFGRRRAAGGTPSSWSSVA